MADPAPASTAASFISRISFRDTLQFSPSSALQRAGKPVPLMAHEKMLLRPFEAARFLICVQFVEKGAAKNECGRPTTLTLPQELILVVSRLRVGHHEDGLSPSTVSKIGTSEVIRGRCHFGPVA